MLAILHGLCRRDVHTVYTSAVQKLINILSYSTVLSYTSWDKIWFVMTAWLCLCKVWYESGVCTQHDVSKMYTWRAEGSSEEPVLFRACEDSEDGTRAIRLGSWSFSLQSHPLELWLPYRNSHYTLLHFFLSSSFSSPYTLERLYHTSIKAS